jgi:hypothetical protein
MQERGTSPKSWKRSTTYPTSIVKLCMRHKKVLMKLSLSRISFVHSRLRRWRQRVLKGSHNFEEVKKKCDVTCDKTVGFLGHLDNH